MSIDTIIEAIKTQDIDRILTYVNMIEQEELDEAISLYEKYYETELNIANAVQDILAQVKARRIKNKIPDVGNYTYELEK